MSLVAAREGVPDRPAPAPARSLLVAAAVAMVVASAAYTWCVSGDALTSGKSLRNLAEIVAEMLPPDFRVVPRLGRPLVETAVMSVMATTLSALLAVPLAFLAARTTTPHPALAAAVRGLFNASRTIPELIVAILFVASVGFGLLPGILALSVCSAGMLGKFYAEAIEKADPGMSEAVAACGGSRLHVILFGVVPQVFAHAVDYTLYRWEHNFRASTVVGMVGAGGIGFEIVAALRLMQYREVSAMLLVVFAVVQLVDVFGGLVRTRLLDLEASR
ncbi:Phosphate-import permease protein PhnE [Aquisphaera giovannonii]|uniref:Phosphate-import permease protein PhnE n=1 Tax=Aquisphaera giovannonii TaxID=406548 RepID=A0A5B9W3P6_9BACT|nr:phosphonate ABC transporter, permease protein PhnE [Aquisphaera giovannonii]QEH35243.1 Phosphate-import permease protein PhnE [Aquisphaera giovannonii]